MDEARTPTSFAPIFNNQKGSDSKDPITFETHTTYPSSHKTNSKQEVVKLSKSTPKLRSIVRTSMSRSGRAKRDHTKNLTWKEKLDGIGETFAGSNITSQHNNERSTKTMSPEQLHVKNTDEKSAQPVVLGSSKGKNNSKMMIKWAALSGMIATQIAHWRSNYRTLQRLPHQSPYY